MLKYQRGWVGLGWVRLETIVDPRMVVPSLEDPR
jgi:hypothetical protein